MGERESRPVAGGMPNPPPCMVRYRCSRCGSETVVNAYDGPAICAVTVKEGVEAPVGVFPHRAFMEPLTVVRDSPHPDSADPRGRRA